MACDAISDKESNMRGYFNKKSNEFNNSESIASECFALDGLRTEALDKMLHKNSKENLSVDKTDYSHTYLAILTFRARKGTSSKADHIKVIHNVLQIDHVLFVPSTMLTDKAIHDSYLTYNAFDKNPS